MRSTTTGSKARISACVVVIGFMNDPMGSTRGKFRLNGHSIRPRGNKMNGGQLKRLHEALLSAFPDLTNLAQFVRFEFEIYLQNIAGGNNQSECVFELLKWAEANGKLDEVAQKAYGA